MDLKVISCNQKRQNCLLAHSQDIIFSTSLLPHSLSKPALPLSAISTQVRFLGHRPLRFLSQLLQLSFLFLEISFSLDSVLFLRLQLLEDVVGDVEDGLVGDLAIDPIPGFV